MWVHPKQCPMHNVMITQCFDRLSHYIDHVMSVTVYYILIISIVCAICYTSQYRREVFAKEN